MGADIHGMTALMAEQANKLDNRVKGLRGQANDLVTEAKKLADELIEAEMAKVRHSAERLLANAQEKAQELTLQADGAEETAARWRQIAYTERETADLPPLAPASETAPDTTPWQALLGHWVRVSLSDGTALFGTLAGLDDGLLTLTHGEGTTPVRPPLGLVERIEPVPEEATGPVPAVAEAGPTGKGRRS